MTHFQQLQTSKSDLTRTRIVDLPETPLAPGEIRMRLDRFGLSVNNLTYAALGNSRLRYWDFYPCSDPEFGNMPVWGFAEVSESTVSGITVGERFYGYFPISGQVRMQPVRITERGFFDGAAHRQELVSAYNQYTRCSTDLAYAPALEALQMLYRPLFLTAFFLADFLTDNALFGARRLLVSSASSKTATATAFCLRAAGFECIALTSPGNRDFLKSLHCYQQVLSYAELEALAADRGYVYLDFSGDAALRLRVHQHLGPQLAHDCLAGFAQSAEFPADPSLPGPAPQLYFAPTQLRKRTADWGPEELNRRLNSEQAAFFAVLQQADSPWLVLHHHRGFIAAHSVLAGLHQHVDPRAGHVVQLD